MTKMDTVMQKRKKFLINMILRKLVPVLSYIWLKDTVSRKGMDIMRPNLTYPQKNFSSKIFSMAKSIFLKES